jgi:hypothetical protein
VRAIAAGLLSVFVAACSGASEGEERAKPPTLADPIESSGASSSAAPREQPMRVLVTGFNDWHELGEPANLWRCRDNPSCRLLLGEAHEHEPREHVGPLVALLETAAPAVEWRFATMPVTWGVFEAVPSDVDVIINLGLGVYDRFDALQLEAGAYNLRRGADAAGRDQSGPIAAQAGELLEAPAGSRIVERLAAVAGLSFAGYEVVVVGARETNSYLCNETHYFALSALALSALSGAQANEGARLREVYFLHIPYAKHGDHQALAEGVAGLVLALLDPPDTLAR